MFKESTHEVIAYPTSVVAEETCNSDVKIAKKTVNDFVYTCFELL